MAVGAALFNWGLNPKLFLSERFSLCALCASSDQREPRDKPFDFTQGHESFDYAQDLEVLEGQRRMASSLSRLPPHHARAVALSLLPRLFELEGMFRQDDPG